MSKNIKVAVAVAVALIGISAVGLMFLRSGSKTAKIPALIPPAQAPSDGQSKAEEDSDLNLPEPTGKVDDVVKTAIDEVSSEEALADQESGDAQDAFDDSEEINDFSQTYDENEF